MIVLPGDYTGTLSSVLAFEVAPESERQPTDTCAARATPRGKWAVCTGAINLAGQHAFDDQSARQVSLGLSLPLSELISEPGEYVIVLNAAVANGDELWDGEFGFYLDAVES